MDDTPRNYIFANLNQKGTDELLATWKKHDQNEWTDQSFDIIREILEARQVAIPQPGEPGAESTEYRFPAGVDVPTDAGELQQRIKDHETQLLKVKSRKTATLVALIVGSVAMLLLVCPRGLKYGNPCFMIMGGIVLLYVGLNAWRLYRHVEKEKQIQTELDSYRVKEAELRAFWEAYW